MRVPTVIVAFTLLAACNVVAVPPAGPVSGGPPADAKALLEVDRAFAQRSLEVGAPQAFTEYMAGDAVLLPTGAPTQAGLAAISTYMNSYQPTTTLKWTPADAMIAGSGDFGVTWGDYELTSPGDDGVRHIIRGAYVTVWRRQDDGSWKAAIDIGNKK